MLPDTCCVRALELNCGMAFEACKTTLESLKELLPGTPFFNASKKYAFDACLDIGPQCSRMLIYSNAGRALFGAAVIGAAAGIVGYKVASYCFRRCRRAG